MRKCAQNRDNEFPCVPENTDALGAKDREIYKNTEDGSGQIRYNWKGEKYWIGSFPGNSRLLSWSSFGEKVMCWEVNKVKR